MAKQQTACKYSNRNRNIQTNKTKTDVILFVSCFCVTKSFLLIVILFTAFTVDVQTNESF